MRSIQRSPAPQEVTDLFINHTPVNWEDFTQNHHTLYHKIREMILRDQLGISGYTELPLESSNNIHIDHFRKKGMFPEEEFHWENFVVDERNNDQYGAGFKDKHLKSKEAYTNILSPVLDIPENYLTYMEDGTIIPIRTLSEQDQLKAKTTRDIFNLNHPFLKRRRQEMILTFRTLKSGGLCKEHLYEYMRNAGFFSLMDYVYAE